MLRTLLLALTLTACTIQSVPPKASGQTPRYVIFDTHVRNVLAADWDRHANDPVVLERAYCLTYQKDVWIIGEFVWRVVEVSAPEEVAGATPHSISYRCPVAPNVTAAHSHPFQSCMGDECVPGGAEAGQCFPSDTDLRSLAWSGQPFAAIICARDAIVFFMPPKG